ncbi:MAG: T9SS type A sorting domain-containing protein [Bacteroidales bacterium]
MKNKILLLAILFFTAFVFRAYPQVAGDIDTTFNPTDEGFDSGDGANDAIRTIAIQSDGKIIIGGDFTSYNSTPRNRIARLNADGSLDTTFNPGTGPDNFVDAIALQSDGKIIIGGYFTSYNSTPRNRIARLNADGSLDTTFNPGTGPNNIITAIALQSDGKIIIGGVFTSYNGTPINRIARLNADGSLDTTFNPGTGPNNIITAIALQSDGKIIIGGVFTFYNGKESNIIARLNTDGSLDPEFYSRTDSFSYMIDIIRCIAIQNDGKIIIIGKFWFIDYRLRPNMARFDEYGFLDETFSSGLNENDFLWAIAIQDDGKIIIGGDFTSYNGTPINRIARLNADGSLDTTFKTGTGPNYTVTSFAFQSDGKVVIGGYFTSYNGIGRNRIARIIGCVSPTITGVTNGSRCDKGSVVLGATASSGIINWYDVPTGGTSLGTGTTFTTPSLSTTTTYYVDATDGACTSSPRVPVTATIKNSSYYSLTVNECDSYTLNGQTYTASGTYTQTLTNAVGCDSVITLNLTINHPSTSVINQTACDSYTLNGETYTASGTYTQTLTNAAGCDSIITLNLTITTVDASVTANKSSITANSGGATYQWVDCNNNYSPIVGAVNQSFTPTVNGNYAVIVTQGMCSDTSVCTPITSVGISSLDKENINIYPNPVSNELVIEIAGSTEMTNFEILNATGQVVYKGQFVEKTVVPTRGFPSGLYLIKLGNKETFVIKKITKK